MSDNSNSGINFLGLLAIAFIILKLCHVISWSWWWILVPIWGGVAGVILFIIVIISLPYLAFVAVNAPILLFKIIKKYCKKK